MEDPAECPTASTEPLSSQVAAARAGRASFTEVDTELEARGARAEFGRGLGEVDDLGDCYKACYTKDR